MHPSIYLTILVSLFISFTPRFRCNKINCDHSIDAALWDHQKQEATIILFSDRYYYFWDLKSKNLSQRFVANETWPKLPSNLDAGCSFIDSSSSRTVYIFLKGNKYWLYRDNDLQASDSLSNLFSFATPKDTRCFTCDAIHGREVGIIAISRSSSSFACTAEFSENKFKQKKCSLGDDDTDITLQKAMNTVGECKAYASKYAHGKLDFVYIGRNGIALAKEKSLSYEPLGLITDCNFLWAIPQLLRGDLTYAIPVAILMAMIIGCCCLFTVWCVCRGRGKRPKYEEDSEGDFGEKPASAPALSVPDTANET